MGRYKKKEHDIGRVTRFERAEDIAPQDSSDVLDTWTRKPRPDLYFESREQARRFLEADSNGSCGD